MTRLTDAEREALRDSWWCAGSTVEVLDAMTADVEGILSARLARAEALLAEGPDTWTPYDSRDTGETFLAESVLDFVAALRAALAPEAEGA